MRGFPSDLGHGVPLRVVVESAGVRYVCQAVPASETDRSVIWKCGKCLRGTLQPGDAECQVCHAVVREVVQDLDWMDEPGRRPYGTAGPLVARDWRRSYTVTIHVEADGPVGAIIAASDLLGCPNPAVAFMARDDVVQVRTRTPLALDLE